MKPVGHTHSCSLWKGNRAGRDCFANNVHFEVGIGDRAISSMIGSAGINF